MKKSKHESSGAVLRTYRCNYHFSLLLNMTLLLSAIRISELIIFFNISVHNSIIKANGTFTPQNMIKRLSISNTILENRKFSLTLFIILTLSVLVTWLCIFLVKAGDGGIRTLAHHTRLHHYLYHHYRVALVVH